MMRGRSMCTSSLRHDGGSVGVGTCGCQSSFPCIYWRCEAAGWILKRVGLYSRWCCTVQMDNDPKHTVLEQCWSSQWADQNPNTTKQGRSEDSCSKCLTQHHQGRSPAAGDVCGLQISVSSWLQESENLHGPHMVFNDSRHLSCFI